MQWSNFHQIVPINFPYHRIVVRKVDLCDPWLKGWSPTNSVVQSTDMLFNRYFPMFFLMLSACLLVDFFSNTNSFCPPICCQPPVTET